MDIVKVCLLGVLESWFVVVKIILIGKCINENCCVNCWVVFGIFFGFLLVEMKGNLKSYVNLIVILMY